MEKFIVKFELSNGLTLFIHDETRRYYEDYHLVRLEVVGEIPLSAGLFPDEKSFAEGRRLLGETVAYRRTLERMGVPYNQIGSVRQELIRSFESNALPYISSEGFPGKLVGSELNAARKKGGMKGKERRP